MRDISLKIRNYKCFGEQLQGFETILPLNIIVGRNNSGKSSLLDLIEYAVKPYDLTPLAHKNQTPEVLLGAPLSSEDIRRVFKPGRRSAEIPGPDHWSFGQEWIGEKISVLLKFKDSAVFVDLSKPLPNSAVGYQGQLATHLQNPFASTVFKHLKAERDIHPETDYDGPVDGNGRGATSIIQQFLNKSWLPGQLVEETLLGELNNIIQPDAHFTDIVVQQSEDKAWEIYLKEEEKGLIALSQSGSGLQTILLVLVLLYLVPVREKLSLDKCCFAFEELENNVHPALQRRLFLYLRNMALEHKTHFFITTHSNVVIDLFSSDPEAQLIHTVHDGRKATVRRVEAYVQRKGILDDLDVRASDLLQSNGVVWVEGPSDRLYFNRWIQLWSNDKLREGAHYQCVFYGGRLLAHLYAGVQEEERDDLIRMLSVNRNAIILIDSDKRNQAGRLNTTKKRIRQEIESIDGICWITKGREIENYIPRSALAALYDGSSPEQSERYQSFSDYLDQIEGGEGAKFLSNKVLFAERISRHLSKENIRPILDLEERLTQVCERIRKWNGMD